MPARSSEPRAQLEVAAMQAGSLEPRAQAELMGQDAARDILAGAVGLDRLALRRFGLEPQVGD